MMRLPSIRRARFTPAASTALVVCAALSFVWAAASPAAAPAERALMAVSASLAGTGGAADATPGLDWDYEGHVAVADSSVPDDDGFHAARASAPELCGPIVLPETPPKLII